MEIVKQIGSIWIPLIVSIVAVMVSIATLNNNVKQQENVRLQQIESEANKVFIKTTITADLAGTDRGYGKEISVTLQNSSPNPVYKPSLTMPQPMNGLGTSAINDHEFRVPKEGVMELPFQTLPPGEKIEYKNVYTLDLFGKEPPRQVLNKNFRFTFSDVYGNAWIADSQGAQKVS
ncbi:hypothetical protein [Propionimicrobium lymphophilum]|uniref:hypothetical protein n=1 Tax=Propionimicrobium lymphophilum TaxID=33012 RepID=UPI0023F3CE30|nr:hypothetical protein [Propionimicrobium lymphophilum]